MLKVVIAHLGCDVAIFDWMLGLVDAVSAATEVCPLRLQTIWLLFGSFFEGTTHCEDLCDSLVKDDGRKEALSCKLVQVYISDLKLDLP